MLPELGNVQHDLLYEQWPKVVHCESSWMQHIHIVKCPSYDIEVTLR